MRFCLAILIQLLSFGALYPASNFEFLFGRLGRGWLVDVIGKGDKPLACGIVARVERGDGAFEIDFNEDITLESRDFCDTRLQPVSIRLGKNQIAWPKLRAVDVQASQAELAMLSDGVLRLGQWVRPIRATGPLLQFKQETKELSELNSWVTLKKAPAYMPGIFQPALLVSGGPTYLTGLNSSGVGGDLTTLWWVNRALWRWRIVVGASYYQRLGEAATGVVDAEQVYAANLGLEYTLLMRRAVALSVTIDANSIFYRFALADGSRDYGHRPGVGFAVYLYWRLRYFGVDDHRVNLFLRPRLVQLINKAADAAIWTRTATLHLGVHYML